MAQVEPMDIDAIESDFDNKENAFQYNNVLSRTPCTEKGYEELDVSELNMKLRYSVTPGSSPMSKSFTGPSLDTKNCNADDYLNTAVGAENGNLTRSLNSTLTKNESFNKTKILPLQTLSTDPIIDSNGNTSMRRLLDQTDSNIVISVNNANELDENLSLPSPCSSVPDTPEATTPTKETPKPEGSPIMRGLKSVLSMFRPSQSPIMPTDEKSTKQEISPVVPNKIEAGAALVSTPVAENKQIDANSSKRSSPLKDSLVFNDDLEKELLWKDETTIIFKDERIPVHKLFLQNPIPTVPKTLNTTVEHMDISCDEQIFVENINANGDQSVMNEHVLTGESDNEFLDCETTFTKNESYITDNNKFELGNDEVQMKGNMTVDVLNDNDISQEITLESKDVMINTTCVIPEVTTFSTDEASVSAADVGPKLDHENNTINIIEATINLLTSESIDYRKININHNTDLRNEKTKKELQFNDQNTTIPTIKQIHVDNEVKNFTEDQPFALTDINDVVSSNDLKDQEIKESEQNIDCDIEKLPEVWVERLNDISNHEKINSEASHTIETKDKNVILEDMVVTVNNIDIVANCFNSDNRTTDIVNVEVGNEPNIDKPNISNELACSQYLNVKSDEHLLTTKIAQDDDIPIKIDNFSTAVNDTNNVKEILDELSFNKDKIAKDDDCKLILEDSKIYVDNIVSNISPDNYKILECNLDDNHKIIGDISVNQATECKNDTIIDTLTLASTKDLFNPMTELTPPLESSTTTANVELKPEINSTHKSNDYDKDVLKTEKEYLLKKNSEINVEVKTDENTLTDKVATSSEISSATITLNLPSDIPLPDEDDIEQHIFEIHDMCNKDLDKQDISTTKTCDLGSNIDVESELVVDNIKPDQSKITLNDITENDTVSVFNHINETNFNTHDNNAPLSYINAILTCNTQSAHVMEVGSESLEQDKTMVDLDSEENSNNIPVPKNKDNKADEDSPSGQIAKNITNNIIEEKSPGITEEPFSTTDIIAELNTEKIEVVSLEKSEYVNQEERGEDNQKDFMVEKEIDEEIITSANNSPYVSVTDLDKIDEKLSNDIIEEIDISNPTNATFVTTPPTSPKIVSKGYNFNFDEIEDPFATKIKIRMSPTPDSPNQSFATATKEIKTKQEVTKKVNRRKSQPEKKKPIQNKNKNSTFSDKFNTKELTSEKQVDTDIIKTSNTFPVTTPISHVNGSISENKHECCGIINPQFDNMSSQTMDDVSQSVTSNDEQGNSSDTKKDIHPSDVEINKVEQTLVISTEKSTSSSEQYFSLGTSSCDSGSFMNRSKNVFNIPEIDDVNFNPFSTKSKMRMSPPPAEKPRLSQIINEASDSSYVVEQAGSYSTINKDSEVTFEIKNGNDSLSNTSNATSSSKNTNDIDSTVREIATEDEDTIEGPILDLDDLKESKKYTEVDIESDMMNFDEVPQQERDENLENGELFIDADAFEFLLNQNKSTTVLDSGKESLFLKFDPLFAKRVSSDGILAALSKVQKRQSTPKKLTKLKQHDLVPVEKSIAGPSNTENCGPMEEIYSEDLSSTVTKPMMVVNPAVSSVMTQKKPATPKLNRRSLTFTSPAMAVIDRLLSLSGNSSHLEHNTSIPQSGRDHSETDLALTQLRELLAEKEINVHTLRCESKELKERLAAMEVQVRGLEKEGAERLTKINELNERLSEKSKINKSMAIVVEEYERTIASLIAETELDKKRHAEERMRLIKERDEQTAHLTSMEVSFSDLHSKYEKSKQIILNCKANEDVYKKSIQEFVDNFSKMQNNYELLKQHATSKLNHANQELEKMNRAHEAEILKLNAMIKRKELHITSLEETLAQKTKANEELTAICDELINKVG